MIRAFLMAAVLATVALAARAAPAPAWTVDKAASSIRFASSFNGAAFSGGFSRWTADIRFDPARLADSSVSVAIDVASAATGDADRDHALPTDTFFAAGRFPRATFAAHSFKALGAGRYLAIGALTLRGVSRPLTLPFTLAIAGAKASMTARLDIDRLAFGVGQAEWRATDVTPAEVAVTIAVHAHRT